MEAAAFRWFCEFPDRGAPEPPRSRNRCAPSEASVCQTRLLEDLRRSIYQLIPRERVVPQNRTRDVQRTERRELHWIQRENIAPSGSVQYESSAGFQAGQGLLNCALADGVVHRSEPTPLRQAFYFVTEIGPGVENDTICSCLI